MSTQTQKNNDNSSLSPFARAAVSITQVSKEHFELGATRYVPHDDADLESFGVGGCGFPFHLTTAN